MRIDSVRLLHVRVPLTAVEPVGPRELDMHESVLVELHSGGYVGRAQADPGTAPNEVGEFAAAAFLCLRDWLAPAIVGREVSRGESLAELVEHVGGNPAAKSALDVAWWQLVAAGQGTELGKLLGAQDRSVQRGIVLGVRPTINDLLADIDRALEQGYASIGLKFRPGWALEVVRAVRSVHPTLPLWIDCDGLGRLAQREMFYRLDDFLLLRIEQPLPADDLVGHAMLAETLRTPLALDQSVTSLERVELALELGSCRQVRIDPQRAGGLTPALAIAAACTASATPLVGIERANPSALALAEALARRDPFAAALDLPRAQTSFDPSALTPDMILADVTLAG